MSGNKNDRGWLLLLAPFLALLLFSGYKAASIIRQSQTARREFSELSGLYYQADAAADTEEPEPGGAAGASSSAAVPFSAGAENAKEARASFAVLPQFNELLAKNRDVVGWVRIDGTALDYPVMYTPDEPEKYIHTAFDGTYSSHGVPFVGAGCSLLPGGGNVIVYGHHMKDGTMFAPLVNYAAKEYWEEHRFIEFSTLYERHRYGIIAALETDAERAESLRCFSFIGARDKADFDAFISGIKAAALYDTGMSAEYGDRLLTLSTCAYNTANGRFLLVAGELPDGGNAAG